MRPTYHYAPASNWLSDPNGLVYHNGEWHLCYQYNPHGEDWGHMSWGHAISSDLCHWTELPPALLEDEQFMIFSGSAVSDPEGSAGFGRDALVAIYTGAKLGEQALQAQCLAWSNNDGRHWEKYPGNPVLDLGMADFRDPNVFWHAPTERWIMVVVLSNEQRALVYASHDLKQWDEMSVIHGAGAPGEVWECPLLIELPVEGTGETRWLFKVDVLRGAPGSGALYQTGTFDGIRFVPDGPTLDPWWNLADEGRDFYAAIAWHEPRDEQRRPMWIGWMGNHAYQGQLPKQGWRGAMSVPRRISLRAHGNRYTLRQEAEPAAIAAVVAVPCRDGQVPASARVELPRQGDFKAILSDQEGRAIELERRGETLSLRRRDAVSPFLNDEQVFTLNAGAPLTLWVDHGSVELFAADGLVCATMQHRMAGEEFTLACQACVAA